MTDGDIVIVSGKSGIYRDGAITIYDGTTTDADPEYIIRIPEELPAVTIANVEPPTLEIGARNMYVEIMQVCLKWHGYKITPDGDFGNLTFSALHDFRSDNYLTGDTVCDGATWEKLFDY